MRSISWSALRSGGVIAYLLTMGSPAALFAQGPEEIIIGVVRDSLGAALSGARVSVEGSTARAVTDASGAFRLTRVQAGTAQVQIRRLGYRPESREVRVQPGTETRFDVQLTSLPIRLPTVEVRRRVEPYDSRLAGFNARRERQVGHFVTREQLDRMSSARFVDALRQMPGVQVRPIRGGGTTVALRGSRCPPLVFIDGFPANAGVMDLDMLDLASVEGIEIYSGVATVPSEFMGARGTHACGVIAVWSRPARPRRPRSVSNKPLNLEELLAERAVYTSDQVDKPAEVPEGSVTPNYPDSLWRAGIPGRVVVEFVVDTAGLVEAGSVRIVSTTHRFFSAAVKSALEGAVFRAARLAGRTVRQIVQLPFLFETPETVPDSQHSPRN
jgi:TonB family protein